MPAIRGYLTPKGIRMKHIRQKAVIDCGVAVAAMLAGVINEFRRIERADATAKHLNFFLQIRN